MTKGWEEEKCPVPAPGDLALVLGQKARWTPIHSQYISLCSVCQCLRI